MIDHIVACHYLFLHLQVANVPDVPGARPEERMKRQAARLAPWPSFIWEHSIIFTHCLSMFPGATYEDKRHLFDGLDKIKELQVTGSDASVETFYRLSTLDPVKRMVNIICGMSWLKALFALGQGIDSEVRVNEMEDHKSQTYGQETFTVINRLGDDGQRTPACVICYQPPQRLKQQHFRLGLRPVFAGISDRHVLTGEAGRFQRHAEALVDAALALTFDCMIQARSAFGILTTGEHSVFVRYDENYPQTLYYHLAEPRADYNVLVPNHMPVCSAAGQLLAFTVGALHARAGLSLRSRPREEPILSLSFLRFSWPRLVQDVPALPPRFVAQKMMLSQAIPQPERVQGQYCTQKCLKGVVLNQSLDEACPNVELHRRKPCGNRHPLDHGAWFSRFSKQLHVAGSAAMVPTGQVERNCMFFRATLLGFGYTFVVKGRIHDRCNDDECYCWNGPHTDLHHERDIYDQLLQLQGDGIPVFLGHLSCVGKRYQHSSDVAIDGFLLLSWGGTAAGQNGKFTSSVLQYHDTEGLATILRGTVAEMHESDVVHRRILPENLLWNELDPRRIMLANLDWALIPPNDVDLPMQASCYDVESNGPERFADWKDFDLDCLDQICSDLISKGERENREEPGCEAQERPGMSD